MRIVYLFYKDNIFKELLLFIINEIVALKLIFKDIFIKNLRFKTFYNLYIRIWIILKYLFLLFFKISAYSLLNDMANFFNLLDL